MKYELYCQNSETGTSYDIVELAGRITHQTTLSGQPGKLTVTLQQDPNEILELATGSILTFIVDGYGVFYGYIFTMGTDATGTYQITAYDQMRYLQNQETYTTRGMTADEIFMRVCKDANLTRFRVVTPSNFIVPLYRHPNKSFYSIIQYGIDRAIIDADGAAYYFIKDKFGELLFTELNEEKTGIIIGDTSLLTSYQYEISIDKDTYNTVKVTRDNEATGKREIWGKFDSENQRKWGLLQLVIEADKDSNEAQMREKAEKVLDLKNRETKTMKLTALGQKELVAGSGFIFSLDKLGIKKNMWITSATHYYEDDNHTMTLEVFI